MAVTILCFQGFAGFFTKTFLLLSKSFQQEISVKK